MRFLADESCDFAVVRAVRAEGHDVLAVSEFQQRSVDTALMEQALVESRILRPFPKGTFTPAQRFERLRAGFIQRAPTS